MNYNKTNALAQTCSQLSVPRPIVSKRVTHFPVEIGRQTGGFGVVIWSPGALLRTKQLQGELTLEPGTHHSSAFFAAISSRQKKGSAVHHTLCL
jgi:hypothetical protein